MVIIIIIIIIIVVIVIVWGGGVEGAVLPQQTKKQKQPQDSLYPWTQHVYGNNNNMQSEKAPARSLDENIHKILQKIVEKFLYYARAIDSKILMALNSLVAVMINPTLETAKQITQFLNYSATHLDTVT